MKPRKQWEPVYRFGGNPADWMKPAPLGTTSGYGPTRPKGRNKRKR